MDVIYKLFLPRQEYIHRVGRTARGEGGVGHALLILRPEELGFLRYLKQAKVPLNEFEFSWSKIANIQPQVGMKGTCGLRFAKRSLMSCVVVIPKEGRVHVVWHRFFFLKKKTILFFLFGKVTSYQKNGMTTTQAIRDLFSYWKHRQIQSNSPP